LPEFEEIVLGKTEKGKKTAWLVGLLVFAVYFVLFKGPAEGYWDTYIAVPAVLMTGEKVDFRSESGEAGTQYSLSQRLPEDLIGKGTYGIATKDQRVGPAALAAPFYQLFDLVGFRFLFALIPCLGAVAFFALVHKLTGKRWLAFAGALLLVLNPFALSFQRMNANFMALAMIAALLLILETEPFLPLLAGIVLGALGGVRNEAIIYVPILLVWVFQRGMQQSGGKPAHRRWRGFRAVLLFVAGAFVLILPVMYWKQYAFGSPIAHPSQYGHFEGYRPTFTHSFLGLDFQFNGMLNYPFADEWVRTPHFPFPVFLTIPLVFLTSFGFLLIGTGMLGIPELSKNSRRLCLGHLAWALLSWVFWAFQENWEELKMSFLFLALPSVVLFIVYGLDRLTSIGGLRKNAVALFTIVSIFVLVLKFGFFLEFPEDSRWYVRFPKAAQNETGLYGLPEKARLDPEFFLTRETREEHVETKRRLTSACLLPCRYLPVDFDPGKTVTGAYSEAATHVLSVRDVWSRIYAQHEGKPAR